MAKHFLTTKEWMNLPWLGKELADYLEANCPQMCQEMKEEGTLFQLCLETGMQMVEQYDQLISQGLQDHEAMEIVREIKYQFEPEETELDRESARLEKEYQETWGEISRILNQMNAE